MRDSESATDLFDDTKDVSPKRIPFTLESTYASVKPSQRPEDFEEIIRLAKDGKAKRTVQKLTET